MLKTIASVDGCMTCLGQKDFREERRASKEGLLKKNSKCNLELSKLQPLGKQNVSQPSLNLCFHAPFRGKKGPNILKFENFWNK